MKKIILSALLAISAASANAAPIDVSLWLEEDSPNLARSASWNVGTGNNAIQGTNSNGTLVSNFIETGDFTFSGTMTATQTIFNDNDIMGIVFGWQDDANHYRLGWEQGGYNDTGSGASGLFLVQEIAGISTILFQQEIFWADLVSNAFSAGRSGNDISFSLGGVSQTIFNTAFTSGRVGFYTESQTANFSGLTSVPQPPGTINSPSILAMLLLGIGFIGYRKRVS